MRPCCFRPAVGRPCGGPHLAVRRARREGVDRVPAGAGVQENGHDLGAGGGRAFARARPRRLRPARKRAARLFSKRWAPGRAQVFLSVSQVLAALNVVMTTSVTSSQKSFSRSARCLSRATLATAADALMRSGRNRAEFKALQPESIDAELFSSFRSCESPAAPDATDPEAWRASMGPPGGHVAALP
jgi:hypothetical protein